MIPIMRLIPGKIVAGQVVLEGAHLDEGENVHVLVDDDALIRVLRARRGGGRR
jgi:hypothetical protein